MLTVLSTAQTSSSPLTYPPARRGDQVDDYHGATWSNSPTGRPFTTA